MEWQENTWSHIYVYDRLASLIYKELIQLNSKK